MKALKLKYKIRKIINKLPNFQLKINISTELVFLFIITTLISTFLIKSIYQSIGDIRKYKLLDDEQAILTDLKNEHETLTNELNYYKSPYYQKLYARESLNLAEENQDLYYIDRKEIYDYELTNQNDDPINVKIYRFWDLF